MYVIEVNPRSSRTVPYISKVTGIPIVPLATKVIIGNKIKELGYTPGLQPEADYVAVKMPVFSFEKIRGADISLGPEMKSTGECLGIAKTFDEALYKAFLGAGIKLPKFKNMIMTVRDEDKPEAVEIGRRFEKIGYRIFATKSTAEALNAAGVKAIAGPQDRAGVAKPSGSHFRTRDRSGHRHSGAGSRALQRRICHPKKRY